MPDIMTKSLIKRFFKGFVAGGVSSAALILHAGVAVHSFGDLKQLGGALFIAFVTGGLLAIEKAINWSPAATQ